MFDSLPQAAWVAAAWLQLVIAYGGYGLYLRSRRVRLERRARDGFGDGGGGS